MCSRTESHIPAARVLPDDASPTRASSLNVKELILEQTLVSHRRTTKRVRKRDILDHDTGLANMNQSPIPI